MATRKTRRSITRAAGKGGARKTTTRKTTSQRAAARRTTGSGSAATGRSAKAGRPPTEPMARPQARRRQRSASTAVKKNGTRLQTDRGTQVLWGANQRRPTRV